MGEEGEVPGNQKENGDEDQFRSSVIDDVYIDASKVLINGLTDPLDKETCLVWLDFIRANKSNVPVLGDYLMLLLLSLHQEVRAVPFDQLPPPIEDFKDLDINIYSLGERIIVANREHRERKTRLSKKGGKCGGHADTLPIFEWSSSGNSTDYLVSQKVPGFGRQCYFSTSSGHLPLWWPQRGEGDYLTRIAEYMDFLQRKDLAKMSECDSPLQSATTRNWWKEAQKAKTNELDDKKGFQWHSLSSLPFSKTKIDKNEILNFYKNTGNQGMDVLTIDEQVEGLPGRTIVENEKFKYDMEYPNVLNVRSHGAVSSARTASDELKDRLKESEYNTSWSNSEGGSSECSAPTSGSVSRRISHRIRQSHSTNQQSSFSTDPETSCPEERTSDVDDSTEDPQERTYLSSEQSRSRTLGRPNASESITISSEEDSRTPCQQRTSSGWNTTVYESALDVLDGSQGRKTSVAKRQVSQSGTSYHQNYSALGMSSSRRSMPDSRYSNSKRIPFFGEPRRIETTRGTYGDRSQSEETSCTTTSHSQSLTNSGTSCGAPCEQSSSRGMDASRYGNRQSSPARVGQSYMEPGPAYRRFSPPSNGRQSTRKNHSPTRTCDYVGYIPSPMVPSYKQDCKRQSHPREPLGVHPEANKPSLTSRRRFPKGRPSRENSASFRTQEGSSLYGIPFFTQEAKQKDLMSRLFFPTAGNSFDKDIPAQYASGYDEEDWTSPLETKGYRRELQHPGSAIPGDVECPVTEYLDDINTGFPIPTFGFLDDS